MCLNCDNEIADMDIRDSDLPNLPFKLVKWQCAVPGCTNGCIVKDFDLKPLYFWPVKIKRFYKEPFGNCWRGGWLDVTRHTHTCSKHHRVEKGIIIESEIIWERIQQEIAKNPNYLMERIVPHTPSKKAKEKYFNQI